MFLREAPFRSYALNLDVRSFGFFWDFCEGDMDPVRMLLSTGSLKHGFLGVPKMDAQKVALKLVYELSGTLFWIRFLVFFGNFVQKVKIALLYTFWASS